VNCFLWTKVVKMEQSKNQNYSIGDQKNFFWILYLDELIRKEIGLNHPSLKRI